MERLIKFVFRVFVFLLPTQLAYHFWPDWALIFGIRVDYLSPAVYLTDVLAVALIALYFFQKKEIFEGKAKTWFAIGLFVLLNTVLAKAPAASFLRWVKIFEIYLIFLVAKNTKELDFIKDFLRPLLFSSFFFSFIGILQFLKGATLGGPLYFLGERSFDLLTPGIALMRLAGRDVLRAYSTFSHPNSLAGFLSVVLILALTQKKKIFTKGARIIVYGTIATAILMTFSLGAAVSLTLSVIFYVFFRKKPAAALLLVGGASALLFFASSRLPFGTFPESTEKRLVLTQTAKEIFFEKPIFGAGLNNFVVRGTRLLQPVHNIYLLVLSETGIVGIGVFFSLISTALGRASRSKIPGIYPALLLIIFSGLFDHYFLTLQQNLLLFSLVFGYSLRRG